MSPKDLQARRAGIVKYRKEVREKCKNIKAGLVPAAAGVPGTPSTARGSGTPTSRSRNTSKDFVLGPGGKLGAMAIPQGGVVFVVEVEPWISAPEGTRGVDDALATFQRGSHASSAELNQALGGLPSLGGTKYDYDKSIVLSLKDKDSDDVVCAAICVEHDGAEGGVLEVIWFVTQRKLEGKGYGSILFQCIVELATNLGVKALVVTSTAQATGFWLKILYTNSPKKAHKFGCSVVRSKQVEKRLEDVTKLELSPRQQEVLIDMRNKEGRNFETGQPPAEVAKYYSEYSGRKKGGKGFSGRPYRYDIETSSHIWFRIGDKKEKKDEKLSIAVDGTGSGGSSPKSSPKTRGKLPRNSAESKAKKGKAVSRWEKVRTSIRRGDTSTDGNPDQPQLQGILRQPSFGVASILTRAAASSYKLKKPGSEKKTTAKVKWEKVRKNVRGPGKSGGIVLAGGAVY
jgi:GNAT superfamily N-acetyltransferase